ncbi:hypothetical protein RI367_000993 [Sorochytrium milnesiophthora]
MSSRQRANSGKALAGAAGGGAAGALAGTAAGAAGTASPRPGSSSAVAAKALAKKEQQAKRKDKKPQDEESHEDVKFTESTSLTEAIFTVEFVRELQSAVPDTDRTSKIAARVGLAAWNEDLRENILVSFHMSNFTHVCPSLFGVEHGLSPDKTACLMNIMKAVLDQSQDASATYDQTCLLVKRLVLKCTRYKPGSASNEALPGGLQVFAPTDILPISHFIRATFLDHYRLFTYVMANEQQVEQDPPMSPRMLEVTARIEQAVDVAGKEFSAVMEAKERALRDRLAELERSGGSGGGGGGGGGAGGPQQPITTD